MGAKVSFKITDREHFSEDISQNMPSYIEGQIIFVEGLNKIFLDFHNERNCYTPDTSRGMNYVGISTSDPTLSVDGKITLVGESGEYTPSEKDVVVWKQKEYMYRKGTDGKSAWFEIGDEAAPEWN